MNKIEPIRPAEILDSGEGPRLPGKFQGRVKVALQTGEAVALLDGRRSDADSGKTRIYGLRDFATRMRTAVDASRRGDPFADYLLVMVEGRMKNIRDYVKTEGRRLQDLRDERMDKGVTGVKDVAFTVETWSTDPIVEDGLRLGGYGSQALFCLGQYDDLVRLCKGLQYHEILTPSESWEAVHKAGREIRGLFAMGSNFMHSGCKRADLEQKNRVAMNAVLKLMERRFLDHRMFNGIEDVFDTFAKYDQKPRYSSYVKENPEGENENDGSGGDAE